MRENFRICRLFFGIFFRTWSQDYNSSAHCCHLSSSSINALTTLSRVNVEFPATNPNVIIFYVFCKIEYTVIYCSNDHDMYNIGSSGTLFRFFFQTVTAMLLLRCCHRLSRVCPFNTQRCSSSVSHMDHIVQLHFSLWNVHVQLIIHRISFVDDSFSSFLSSCS